MTNSDAEYLKKALLRERNARKESEQILLEKSRSLYESQVAVKQAQRKLELALWASNESIWEWHVESGNFVVRRFNRFSDSTVDFTYTLDEFFATIHPDDFENYRLQWRLHLDGCSENLDITFRALREGEYKWIRLRGRVVEESPEGLPRRLLGTSKDITELRNAERSSRLMASAFSSSRDAMLILQRDKKIIEANAAFYQLIGEKVNKSNLDFNDYIKLSEEHIQELKFHERVSEESEVRTVSGQITPVEVTYSKFMFEEGSSSYLVAVVRDMTERKNAEKHLQQMAMYDSLTGLFNRNAFQQKLSDPNVAPERYSVLFIDLDGFKAVNDTMSHEKGDELLVAVSSLLGDDCLGHSITARWGGDEFIVATETTDEQQIITFCRDVINGMKRIGKEMQLPVAVSASIGIALFPDNADDHQSLIRAADAAMYQAKSLGKSAYVFYDESVEKQAQEKISLLAELKKAIDNNSLDFHLQGQFDQTDSPSGAELLCRWNSPIHGFVSPAVFIPLAEENGLAFELGNLAIDNAIRFVQILDEFGYNLRVAVNISPLHLMHPDFVTVLQEKIAASGLYPNRFELEVTESSFLGDEIRAGNIINELRKMGYKMAMDDFGTGYSSLSYIRKLDFDVIKIDRAFVTDLESDYKAQLLLQGIISICNELGVETVAEGIETQEQMDMLQRMGVTSFQGFYLGRPVPIEAFIDSLKKAE